VARYKDGRVMKGFTNDFVPNRPFFHLSLADSSDSKPLMVQIQELKAVFFVKDFKGDSSHKDSKDFTPGKPLMGRKIRVLFRDGEELIGTTQGYQQGRPVFFLVPADSQSNIERCLIVASATKEVAFI
jgi:Family of unknown function (DUF6982)